MRKLRITKGSGWYEDRVGEEFDVVDTGYIGGTPIYRVKYFGNVRTVYAEDCEALIVTEPFESESEEPASDAVSHPSHYTQGGIEVIDIIAQTVAGYDDPFVGHCVGTSTKYLNRAPYKHETPIEDLRKAGAYIQFAIDHINEKLTKEGE